MRSFIGKKQAKGWKGDWVMWLGGGVVWERFF